MTMNLLTIEVHGVKPTLEYLRKMEPEVYKTLTKELRATATPLARTVAASFPASSG